ncbi:hypothetical protein EXIGLDRAFT_783263 [Exidia glandulosa HHB12029]|uniref:Uncharacterized protein n=1 Tax=Exidia glandulosa HHB12029 TaxID=1314781 RepID=A0A166N600_EXIGL|nr:hypothetical protein EXIGLDRAFT_783263 [Exidia glandulosa HHB12029]
MDPRLPHDVLRLVIERATEQALRTARIVRLVSRTTAAWASPLACTLLVTARNQARIFDMNVDETVRRHFAAHIVYLIMASDVDYIGHDGGIVAPATRLYTSATHIYFEPLDAMDEEGLVQFLEAVSALLALPTCKRLLLRVSVAETLSYAVRALAMLENAIEDSRIFVEDTFSYSRDYEQEALESSARWSCGVPLRDRTFTTPRDEDTALSAI